MREDDKKSSDAESRIVTHSSHALVSTASEALARRGLRELDALLRDANDARASKNENHFLFCLEHACAHELCPDVSHLEYALVAIKQGSKLPDSVPEQIDIVAEEWTHAELAKQFALPSADSHPVSHAWTRIGVRFASIGRHVDALICYDKALQFDDQNFAAWADKGTVLPFGSLEAMACLKRAVELNPQCLLAWQRTGNMLSVNGDWTPALSCYDKAIEIDPLNHEWTLMKAGILLELGREQEALKCYDVVVRLSGGEAGWGGRGAVLHALGRYEEALGCQDERLRIIAKHSTFTPQGRANALADVWNAKAASLYRLGRYYESIECCEKAVDFDSKSQPPWYNKGNNLMKLGMFEEAIRCYDKAIELWSGDGKTWNNQGRCLREVGRLEEALTCHERATICDPPEVLGWYNKASIQEELGQKEDAVSSYEHYLSHAPNNSQHKSNREHARSRLRELRFAGSRSPRNPG